MANLFLTCPQCEHQTDFLSALRDNEQRAFIARMIKDMPGGKTQLVMRYLAMFKPAKNAQSFSRLNNLFDSLLTLLDSGEVSRQSEVRAAPRRVWFEGMAELTTNKPESLELPLKTHNYLAQIVWKQCEKAEAKAEAQLEKAKRSRARDDVAGTAGLTQLKNAFDPTKKGNS